MKWALRIGCAALVCTTLCFACTNAARAQNVTIEGWISTAQDQPVANVKVKVWRQSQVVQSTSTDKDGHYMLTAPEGTPLDAITFDPPDMTVIGPGAIDHLSGKRNQKIGAVLYETGQLSQMLIAAAEGRTANVNPLVGQKNQLKRIMSLEAGAGTSPEALQKYKAFAQKLAADGAKAQAQTPRPGDRNSHE